MTLPCNHKPYTGLVTSLSEWSGGHHAEAPVCNDQVCIDDAKAWVKRVTGKPAKHVRDEMEVQP